MTFLNAITQSNYQLNRPLMRRTPSDLKECQIRANKERSKLHRGLMQSRRKSLGRLYELDRNHSWYN